MEYCACGSMKDIYSLQRQPLGEEQLREVIAFAVLGLNHIHNLRCLHRV
jgi:serine/threonine protein kinase